MGLLLPTAYRSHPIAPMLAPRPVGPHYCRAIEYVSDNVGRFAGVASSRHRQLDSVYPDVTDDGRLRVADASLQVEECWYALELARVTFLGRPTRSTSVITWAKGRDGRAVP